MTNLFQRAAICTDLHLGKKNNDKQHNIDCVDFMKWFIKTAQDEQADCIIFLGDFFDNRHSIQVSTLDFSLTVLDLLDALNLPAYFIPGNHDEMYKDRRDLSSLAIVRNFKNIRVLDDITTISNVTFCPWLIGEEWKSIPKVAKQSTYIFGHFELPLFMMNAMVEMPDHGGLNYRHFDDVKQWAFSGHFHKKQSKGKVIYLGNAFPHNFSDVWDDDRGMAILDWEQTPKFIRWPSAPSYKTFQLSELLDNPESLLNDRTYARVSSDLDITHNQVQLIRDIFQAHYTPRRIEINNKNIADDNFDIDNEPDLKTVDQIVVEGLANVDSVHLDKNLLIQIYQSL